MLGLTGFTVKKHSREEKLNLKPFEEEFRRLREVGGHVDEVSFTECALGETLPGALKAEGYGIYPSLDDMRELGELAARCGVKLGCHASYLVNFGSKREGVRKSSKGHLTAAHKRIAEADGLYVVTHLGYLEGASESDVRGAVIEDLSAPVHESKVPIALETAGKRSAIGSLPFLIDVASEVGAKICVDWAHLHAYGVGALFKEDDIIKVVDQVEKGLGSFHKHVPVMHISGIRYGAAGEIEHVGLEESDLPWHLVVKILGEVGVIGKSILTCESPKRFDDVALIARVLRGEYEPRARRAGQRRLAEWF